MKVDFEYQEGRSVLPSAKISFWLHTKRGKRIYSQEFVNMLEQSWRQEYSFEKLLYYKVRELLLMLERQLSTGYLTELRGGWHDWTVKQRKLTKNTWITAERI